MPGCAVAVGTTGPAAARLPYLPTSIRFHLMGNHACRGGGVVVNRALWISAQYHSLLISYINQLALEWKIMPSTAVDEE